MTRPLSPLPSPRLLAALLLTLLPSSLAAQLDGSLTGRVVEAEMTGEPVAGAEIDLYLLSPGTPVEPLPRVAADRAPDASGRSDREGRYSLTALPAGDYLVRVSRFGYRTTHLHLRMDTRVARLSVALEVDPVPIVGVDAVGRRLALAPLTGRDGGRGAAEALRRRRHLVPDTRLVLRPEIFRSATLAEPDAFRSLQRIPGVASASDWSAAPWSRGGRWDLTLTRLDGMPLFNPYHAGGILSAVPADLVGSVTFHPGVAPASLPGGGAALLDVVSRPGPPSGSLAGEATLSLASAALTLGGGLPTGPGSWRVGLRRSYVDWLAGAVTDDPSGALPYSFRDVGGRIDLPAGEHALTVSALLASDGFDDEIPDVVHGTRASWRNGMARAALSSNLLGRPARHTIGVSRYRLHVESIESHQRPGHNAPELTPGEHEVGYLVARGEFPRSGADGRWSWGYELARWSVDADGPPPRPFLDHDTDALVRPLEGGALTVGAAWAEARLRPGERLEVDLGLRLEAGGGVPAESPVRVAPRLTARLGLDDDLLISAGAGRSYQYVQALSPILVLDQTFPAGYLWALAGSDAPAVRSDVVTLGVEASLGDAWLAGGSLYHRWNEGVVTPVARAGPLEEGSLFSTVSGRTRGAELSLRRTGDGWLFEGAYSYLVAREELGGQSHPAPGDRRHVVDISASANLTGSLRADVSYTRASGAPYTRIRQICGEAFRCADDDPIVLGQPNGQRREPFHGLQLGLAWSRPFRGWEVEAFVQLRNLLARNNPGAYNGTEEWCPGYDYHYQDQTRVCSADGGAPRLRDTFTPGMPLLPLLGVRVEF